MTEVIKDIEDALFTLAGNGLVLDYGQVDRDYEIMTASCMKRVCNFCTPPDPMNPPTESLVSCGDQEHYCVKHCDLLWHSTVVNGQTVDVVDELGCTSYQVGTPTCPNAPDGIWDWIYDKCYLVCTY